MVWPDTRVGMMGYVCELNLHHLSLDLFLFLVLNLFACAGLALQQVGTTWQMALSWQYVFQMENGDDTCRINTSSIGQNQMSCSYDQGIST